MCSSKLQTIHLSFIKYRYSVFAYRLLKKDISYAGKFTYTSTHDNCVYAEGIMVVAGTCARGAMGRRVGWNENHTSMRPAEPIHTTKRDCGPRRLLIFEYLYAIHQ